MTKTTKIIIIYLFIIQIVMAYRNSAEKRETSKWIILIDHKIYWKCILLVKEDNWKYWLPWWWVERKDNWSLLAALKRELGEELGKDCKIVRKRDLGIRIETQQQINNVFALQCNWKIKELKKETSKQYNKKNNEIHWFALYPLNKKWWARRKILKRNMEYYAKKAIEKFKNEHHRKENYESSNVRFERPWLTNRFRYRLFWTLKCKE